MHAYPTSLSEQGGATSLEMAAEPQATDPATASESVPQGSLPDPHLMLEPIFYDNREVYGY